jgi:hypothetical protein
VKARKVRHLDPAGTLADNAERIVARRLDELCSFVPAVLDESNVVELHDMRIAAKRLRYVLEVTAEPCFGPYARPAAKRAKELQDLLGEIHDCDVQLPRVEQLLVTLRDEDADELRRRAGEADDLDPALAARLPHADIWRGLVALETYLRARRDLLYARFLVFWRDLERDGFRARLEYAIGERPEPPAPKPERRGRRPLQPGAARPPVERRAPSPSFTVAAPGSSPARVAGPPAAPASPLRPRETEPPARPLQPRDAEPAEPAHPVTARAEPRPAARPFGARAPLAPAGDPGADEGRTR